MAQVLVVGGGIAGLAAAHHLKKAGIEVRVLEASARPGGRVSTLHREGAIIDTGAQFFGPRDPYVHTFELLEGLGLLPSLQSASHHAAMVKAGKPHAYRYGSAADFLKLPVLSLSAKLRMMKVFPEIKRYAHLLDFHRLERAAAIDDQDMEQFVGHLAGKDAVNHLLQPLISAFYYYPKDGISRAFLLTMLHGLGDLGTHCLRGGNQQLTDSLAAHLDVTLSARVVDVTATPKNGTEVTWEEEGSRKGARADAVIMAAPADIALQLCPGSTPAEREFLHSVHYTTAIGLAFRTDRPFGGAVYGVAVAAEESKLLSSITFEQNKSADRVPPGQGLTIAFLNAASSLAMLNSSAEEISGAAAAEMDRFWPGHDRSTQWVQLFRHPRATPLFPVGSIRRLDSFLKREERTPSLVFCGDYLCGPHLEGAITSGLRAAEEVIGSLS